MDEQHSPGRMIYDADWRELKLEENGYVIATLSAPHQACRGKERIEELATIRANGERLAALWNAALSAPQRYALNPDNGLMYESERGPWVRHLIAATDGVMEVRNDQRQVREDSQGLGEPGRLSPSTDGVPEVGSDADLFLGQQCCDGFVKKGLRCERCGAMAALEGLARSLAKKSKIGRKRKDGQTFPHSPTDGE